MPFNDAAPSHLSRTVFNPSGTRRLLILGNSITLHPPKPDIGWNGNWGMAASSQDKDYVHRLIHRLNASANDKPKEIQIENIADFEREHRSMDLIARFQPHADFKPDLVILAIGENVSGLTTDETKAAFGKAVTALLTLLKQNHSPRIFVRSTFWHDSIKDAILKQASQDTGATFVDISELGRDEKNYARSEHDFAHAGVAAHPGDTGMAAIADALWNAISAR